MTRKMSLKEKELALKLREAQKASTRMFERDKLLEKACAKHSFDIEAIAEELGIHPSGVAKFLERREITGAHLAVWHAADRHLSRRLLKMREEAIGVMKETLEHGSDLCRLKAAEMTLNYCDKLSEKIELTALAHDIINLDNEEGHEN